MCLDETFIACGKDNSLNYRNRSQSLRIFFNFNKSQAFGSNPVESGSLEEIYLVLFILDNSLFPCLFTIIHARVCAFRLTFTPHFSY